MIKRIIEHEQNVQKSVNNIIQDIKKGDVGASVSYSQSVDFEHNKLQSIDDISNTSIFCRIFHEGKVGNAAINHPQYKENLIKNAYDSSIFGEEINFSLPSSEEYTPLSWSHSEKNLQFSKKDLKDIAEELLSEIQKFAPNAKISTGAHNYFSQTFLQNTNGFYGESQHSFLSLYGGLFELASDGSFLEMYESRTFYDDNHHITSIVQQLQERIERSRITSSFDKEGLFPVIIAPAALDLILSPLEIALNGKTLYKGLSLFADRKNQQVASPLFSMEDDPLYLRGAASTPFDDEGTVTRKLSLIEEGIFKNFIFDCSTAHKMNTQSTGHASRGSLSLPYPALSNRIIKTGNLSLDQMISGIDYGLLLFSSLGEGQSNVMAGDFSVLAETAYLIENGTLKGRVKDLMLSGNSFDALNNIMALENKQHKEHSLFAPHILFDKIKISTKNS